MVGSAGQRHTRFRGDLGGGLSVRSREWRRACGWVLLRPRLPPPAFSRIASGGSANDRLPRQWCHICGAQMARNFASCSSSEQPSLHTTALWCFRAQYQRCSHSLVDPISPGPRGTARGRRCPRCPGRARLGVTAAASDKGPPRQTHRCRRLKDPVRLSSALAAWATSRPLVRATILPPHSIG